MPHELVLEATTGRGPAGSYELHRFRLAWAAGSGFDLQPLQGEGPHPRAGTLVTGEHVQWALEDAGYRLEAESFHALFSWDDEIRGSEAPLFLVRDPGSGRVGVCATTGHLLGPPIAVADDGRLSRATTATLLAVAAPIGFQGLRPPWITERESAAELALFAGAVGQVWTRQGVLSVRDVQDWAMARASGHERMESRAVARLQVGATGFWGMVRLTVAISTLRDYPRQADVADRPTIRRSASVSVSVTHLQGP